MTATVTTNSHFLEVPETSCVAAADRLPWADRLTVHGSPWNLGIKCNTVETNQIVRRLLSDIARPELDSPFANLRVALHPAPSTGGHEDLNVLYHKCKPALRSRNPRRVLEALISWVDSYRQASRIDLLAVNAQVIAHDDRCVLVAYELDRDVRHGRRRLIASGLTCADSPIALLDARSGEVVVEPPAFAVSRDVLEEVDRAIDPDDAPVAPGRYVVDAVLVRSRSASGAELSKARGVYALAYSVANRSAYGGPQRVLDDLTRVVGEARTTATSGLADELVSGALSALDASANHA